MIAARQQAGQAWRRRSGRRRAHPRGCGACISTAGMARCISRPPILRAAASMKRRRSFFCTARMAAAPTSAAARRSSARTVRSTRRTCRAVAVPIPLRAEWRSRASRSRSPISSNSFACGASISSVAAAARRSRTSWRPRGKKKSEGWSLREHSSPQLPSPSPCCSFPPIRAASCKSPAEDVAAEIRSFLDRV